MAMCPSMLTRVRRCVVRRHADTVESVLGTISAGCSTASTTILTFLLVDIQRSFTRQGAGRITLGTITLIFRVAGIGASTAADRWGRKGPLMFSILWYRCSRFSAASRPRSACCSRSRAVRHRRRVGGGYPATLGHWPAHLRGTASGLMQNGYSMGTCSSLVFEFVYPRLNAGADMGWRWMMWIGILPSFLVFFIMRGVRKAGLARRQAHPKTQSKDSLSRCGCSRRLDLDDAPRRC